tara:strand:+ start:14974 stop:15150 length:177 start_codon:yes stop_codon:yes gene_type:complete
MEVMNHIIEQSSLHGMPNWFKALAIAALITIVTLIVITLILLLKDGGNMTINYGYLYN